MRPNDICVPRCEEEVEEDDDDDDKHRLNREIKLMAAAAVARTG